MVDLTPEKCKGMIEKIALNEALGSLSENSSVDSLLGVYNSKGCSIQKKDAIRETGSVSANLTEGKWYRIAVSKIANNCMSTAILSISTVYNNDSPRGCVAVIYANGYTANKCDVLSKTEGFRGVIRVLYKSERTGYPILEFKATITGTNSHAFTYGNTRGFYFQTPVEVPDTPEEGYEVDEFVIN